MSSPRKQTKKQNKAPGKALSPRLKNKKERGWDGQTTQFPNAMQRLPRSPTGLILPDRYRTTLRYWKSVSFNLAAVTQASVRFAPSNAFDIDPVIASTAMSGFDELAGLYQRYRVLSSTIEVETINPSTLYPVLTFVTPVNNDPGASPSATILQSMRENAYSVSKTCGLAGGPITLVANKMSTEKIFGSKMSLFDDAFQSLVTTSPTNNWWWVIVAYSPQFITNSVQSIITIEVDVEFFDRIAITH